MEIFLKLYLMKEKLNMFFIGDKLFVLYFVINKFKVMFYKNINIIDSF